MNASNKLDQYLESFGQRLKTLTLIQGVAITAAVLLVVSVIGAWFASASGYASDTVNISRIILILALAAIIFKTIVQPLKKLKRGVSEQVERRATDKDGQGFDGRITTYAQMKASGNPFRDLLAEDALKVSGSYPLAQQIEQKELNLAGAGAGIAAGLLIFLLIAGPANLNYSLRNLFAGWAVDGLLPPQSIVVAPGDQSVRRGANLRITAAMEGFNPDDATIHIQSGDAGWQEVPLVKSPGGFEFTFFSMQEPMSYYVSTTGLRSPEFDIQVVDVPSIEGLSLTYHYPDWAKRDAETFTLGDIQTLLDTSVELTVTTTSPLSQGELVLNSVSQPLSLNGNEASTEFLITEEGEYFIAAVVGGEQIRLSDDFFIRLTEDGKPVIEFTRPGEDYNASSIEEVLVRLEASDDYGLDNVALKYSINGSDFQTIDMSAPNREIVAEHIFMLEDMRTEVSREVTTNIGAFNIVLGEDEGEVATEPREETEAEPEFEIEEVPLQPGDLISYYAEATDRSQTVRTDMFFIQLQSYKRRYTQSQLSGGGGGGGGGNQQDEISQRQRQIIVSTWNLIREQAENEETGQVELNSALLSDLQTTLAEQAQTLTERTRARQLSQDAQIESFVASMEQAVQAMYPASEQLAAFELDKAIGPAQEALRHLLRAEAVFNDITVNQQEGGGGGGGGQASEDLAEMFELEMDIEKNQYETANTASAQAQQQEAEDIMAQLDELARRQEQLSDSMRNQQQISEAQRFQQELLRREAEKLQEQLERMEQQNQQQQGQQQANNQQDQQGQQQGGQQGEQGQSGQGQQNGEQVAQQSELQRRLESAIRAMNESAEAMGENVDQAELQRAAQEAQNQLEGARDQVAQEQLANMQESFGNMASKAEAMLRDQQRMEQALQDAVAKAVEERESGADPDSRGMPLQEEWALAKEKQEMVADLQNLQQEMLNSMQRFDQQVPEASRELQQANNELAESEVEQALSDAALYIDAGYGLYIAGNESNVTAGMRDLAESLERAQGLAQNAATPGDSELDRARRQAQDLRAQLQEQLAQSSQQAGQPGQQGQGQQPGEGQPGQEGQQQGQGGQQQGGSQPGGSPQQGGGRFGAFGGAWAGNEEIYSGPISLPQDFYNDVDEFTELARAAVSEMNLNTEELAEMYDLIRELEYSRVNRNDSIIAQEYNAMLALIEQLEVNLQLDSADDNPNNVRTAVTDIIPEEYRDSVAEYYRRLSQE